MGKMARLRVSTAGFMMIAFTEIPPYSLPSAPSRLMLLLTATLGQSQSGYVLYCFAA